jgi:hypothetical protein
LKETPPEDEKNGSGSNVFRNLLKEKEHRKSEFIAAIIANIILLYIVNNLLAWNLHFITSSFQEVLWIINISIAANIIANFLFLIYNQGWFRSLVQIPLNIIGFIVAYSLYIVFPFSFSQMYFTYAAEFILIILMVIFVIMTFFEVLKLIMRIFMK